MTDNVRDVRVPASLKEELRNLLYQVKHEKMDLVIVVDGKEGSGKSQTARTLGAFCAEELGTMFGVENIHYGTEEYMRSSESMGQFTVHILDEAGVILHRASANTREARRFTKYLQVAREGNNQVHIIVLPAYHILDGYVVNWRCKLVMNMYTSRDKEPDEAGIRKTRRGAFMVYPRTQQLTEMWNLYQDRKVFVYPKQYFIHDRMPNCEVLSDEELQQVYDKKKKWRAAFIDDDKQAKVTPTQMKALRKLYVAFKRETKMTDALIAKEMGVSDTFVHELKVAVEVRS